MGFIPLLGTDWREDFLILVVAAGAAGAAFTADPSLAGQARFMVRDTAAFVLGDNANTTLSVTREHVELINGVVKNSIHDRGGDERLFCGVVENGRVVNLRVAGNIKESSPRSVAGSCFSRVGEDVDLFVHSQPDGNFQLSAEDRHVESRIDYSCIVADRVVVSPVSGAVGGIRCWQVDGVGDDASFTPVEVRVR